jgi:DNA-binding CsgD family transcriptional regulator
MQAGVALRDRLVLSLAAQSAVVVVGARAKPAARARLLGATDTLAQATGATPAWERLTAGQDVAALRERLARGTKGEVAAAYREGRALPFGEVAALALRLLEEVATSHPDADGASGVAASSVPLAVAGAGPLSEREQEVLRLVAQGLSSKAIGRQLFLSPSTVSYHLTSVFNKLGVNTRAQAVAVAAERGLL